MERSIRNLVRYEEFRIVENDCKDMIRYEDLDKIISRVETMEKRSALFLKSEEFHHRINSFQRESKE